jgi:conjugative relaxase-like TrwC/TraI family protein
VLVSITPLGSVDGDPRRAAHQVVGYVEAKISAARRVAIEPGAGVRAYYADSVEGPGWWTGQGSTALGLDGEVDPEHLQRVLLGKHPGTGAELRTTKTPGPTGEARRSAAPEEPLSLTQAARLAGVSRQYLGQVAARTEREMARRLRELFLGLPLSPTSQSFLVAHRPGHDEGWLVERGELQRFVASRKPARTVIGYDVTFSAPKSVSVLWATAGPEERREITGAVEAAVRVGLDYLEGATSTRNRRRPDIRGLVAAAFMHGTSRNLDPQLHVHSVIANVVETLDGEIRALDGRDLFAHGKAAGYLAAAELRHQTARRLGWQWEPVVHGLSDVVGVPPAAVREMSSRHLEIDSLAAELGIHSAAGRQIAAYRTRPAKGAVDPEELRAEWDQRLAAVGFDGAARAACFGRQVERPLVTADDRHAVTTLLASARGVTEQTAVFDRRDVIQAVATWANDRLPARDILDLADEYLASEHVVALDARHPARSADVIRLKGGRVVTSVSNLTLYSTPAMLAAERRVLDAFAAGVGRGVGVVPDELLNTAIRRRPSLGVDQAAMIRAICTSGDQFQCVLGPAGSGKTFALGAARDAWEAAGYTVLGAADQGTAAEVLGAGAGVRAETLEYWLTVLDTHPEPASVLGPRTIMLVDEASTAGTRSLARLFAHAARTGATVRLIGDPAQHSAVTAGGAFRDLARAYPDRTPALSELRRQQDPQLHQLRLALGEYRDGLIAEALDRLRADDRVVLADTADELLDKLAADWWIDRRTRRANPALAPSSMVAEHHRERRALNARARLMLQAAGELTGPTLVAGAHEFRAGDEVICRAPAKHLHPPGAPHRYLRNGTRGTVSAVHTQGNGEASTLTVDFENRGAITVPREFLTLELRPGIVGGLTHSYALTSHAAQGQTHEAARTLATDGSSRPGLYVGLTRGRSDARMYAVRRRDVLADPDADDHMPRLDDEKHILQAITDRLTTSTHEQLATTIDPQARDIAATRSEHTLAVLVQRHRAAADATQRVLLARAVRAERDSIARRAQLHPDPDLVARIGKRPRSDPDRRAWNAAVAAVALHRELGTLPAAQPADLGLPDPARAASLMRDAEIAHLGRQPTARLADEANQLARDLTHGSVASTTQRRQRTAALARADHGLTAAQRAEADAHAQLQRADRRLDPRAREHAQHALDLARHRTATAALHRERLAGRLAILAEDDGAHEPAESRLERLHAAIERQVQTAVERARTNPPEYVTRLLGHRPPGQAGAAWDTRVHQLESYRHHHGHSIYEHAAPAAATPSEQALGPRPENPAARIAWDNTAQALTAPLTLPNPSIAHEL